MTILLKLDSFHLAVLLCYTALYQCNLQFHADFLSHLLIERHESMEAENGPFGREDVFFVKQFVCNCTVYNHILHILYIYIYIYIHTYIHMIIYDYHMIILVCFIWNFVGCLVDCFFWGHSGLCYAMDFYSYGQHLDPRSGRQQVTRHRWLSWTSVVKQLNGAWGWAVDIPCPETL